jgi:hypothetical protein
MKRLSQGRPVRAPRHPQEIPARFLYMHIDRKAISTKSTVPSPAIRQENAPYCTLIQRPDAFSGSLKGFPPIQIA